MAYPFLVTVTGWPRPWIRAAVLAALCAMGGLHSSCGGEQDDGAVRMLFAPSQNPTTMLHLAASLERFVADDAGIPLRAVIPESYLEVVEGLSRGDADVAWAPPFTYVVANQKSGAEARLQVERSFEQSVILVCRSYRELRPVRCARARVSRRTVPSTFAMGCPRSNRPWSR